MVTAREFYPTSVSDTERSSKVETIGWEPTCKCGDNRIIPALVLNIFHGSGTTGINATLLGRDYCAFEINPDYIKLEARRRDKELGLFSKKESKITGDENTRH